MVFLRLVNFWAGQYDIIRLEVLGTTILDDLVDTIALFVLYYHIESLKSSLWSRYNGVNISP